MHLDDEGDLWSNPSSNNAQISLPDIRTPETFSSLLFGQLANYSNQHRNLASADPNFLSHTQWDNSSTVLEEAESSTIMTFQGSEVNGSIYSPIAPWTTLSALASYRGSIDLPSTSLSSIFTQVPDGRYYSLCPSPLPDILEHSDSTSLDEELRIARNRINSSKSDVNGPGLERKSVDNLFDDVDLHEHRGVHLKHGRVDESPRVTVQHNANKRYFAS